MRLPRTKPKQPEVGSEVGAIGYPTFAIGHLFLCSFTDICSRGAQIAPGRPAEGAMAGNGPSWARRQSPAQSDTAHEQTNSGVTGEWRLTAEQRDSVATRGFCVVERCVPMQEVAARYRRHIQLAPPPLHPQEDQLCLSLSGLTCLVSPSSFFAPKLTNLYRTPSTSTEKSRSTISHIKSS